MESFRLWMRVFLEQFSALIYKNFLLSLRRKRATFLGLSSSFFFILLLFGVDRTIRGTIRDVSTYRDVKNPQAVQVASISPCENAYFMRNPCYDFVWSGNTSSDVGRIVQGILQNNPGRSIPNSKVLSFSTPADVDAWFLDHPLTCPGALHFQVRPGNVIAYGVQVNSSVKTMRGKFEDPIFKFQIPLQAAAEQEIARFIVGDSKLGWKVSFAQFAHPPKKFFSAIGVFGPTFLMAAAMFGFVIQLTSLVSEKELKLRQMMSLMGLLDSVYWSTWLIWDSCLMLISSLVLVLSGMMFQMSFFLDNNFGVLFFMFFLFQLNLVGLSFLLSVFIKRASSANTVGFVVYVVGFLTQLVTSFGFPYNKNYKRIYRIVWSIFPPNVFSVGMGYLGDATTAGNSGITWAGRTRCSPGNLDCVITLEGVYRWLLGTFLLWLVLAIYLDNTLPDVNGVRKPWFYFLYVSYWTGKSSQDRDGTGCCYRASTLPSAPSEVDDDVAAEEALVKEKGVDPSIAVQVHGLVKTFPGSKGKRCCSCCKYEPPHYAVQGSWFTIEKDKLFCLLGSNGAGKTTTINCLTGIIPVTAGDAFVYGESIRTSMSRIRSFMGVCPQFDILWDVLSGREHLRLFARIKGLEPSTIDSKVDEMLAKVNLLDTGNTRSASYSGGMKRRLSVAVALLGDPKILYLDEPTTGMDPVMRRQVWSVIEQAKKGCAIVLTTHSMEEADVLADRIAIMAKGKIQCIGTSIHLKTKFGTGYSITVNVQTDDPASEESRKMVVKSFFQERLNLEPCEESKTYLTFAVPPVKENLAEFFDELDRKRDSLGITDTQLGLTTLEEVFLTIAKQSEIQSSQGRFERLTLNDGMVLMVPIGTRYFPVPGTSSEEHPLGMMVEILWEADENGSLCITDHSELKPYPA